MHVIFDLDGTLANIEHRVHLVRGPKVSWPEFYRACDKDLPIVPVCETLRVFAASADHHVEIWSGRSDEVKALTEAWLNRHALPYRRLRMRPARDSRHDATVKSEWLDEYLIEHGKLPDVVFDDRQHVVDMWRKRGVLCAQVAAGDF